MLVMYELIMLNVDGINVLSQSWFERSESCMIGKHNYICIYFSISLFLYCIIVVFCSVLTASYTDVVRVPIILNMSVALNSALACL